jgi:hypothetical protein
MPNRPKEITSPEITIGSGRSQIILTGRDAIRAAGWSLRFLLFVRGAVSLLIVGVLALYAVSKWWWPSL